MREPRLSLSANLRAERLEVRGVESEQACQATKQTSARQGKDPSAEDPAQLAPIDGLEIVVHQRDTHGCTSQALSGRDGETETRSEEDSDSGTKFDGETARRAHLGDLVAQGTHDVVAEEPETEAEEETGDDQEPNWSWRLGVDAARAVGLEHSGPGTDGVGDIVTTVGDGHHDGGDDLAVGPHMFDADIVTVGTGVDLAEHSGVVGDDVDEDTAEHEEFEPIPVFLRVDPGEFFDGDDPALVRGDVAGLVLAHGLRVFGGSEDVFVVGVGFAVLSVAEGALRAVLVGMEGLLVVVGGAGVDHFVHLTLLLRAGADIAVRISVVVGDEFAVSPAWPVERWVLSQEEWAHGKMPDADSRVLADELRLEERNEEDVAEGHDAEEDCENAASDLTGDIGEIRSVGNFDGNEEGEDTSGQAQIEGNESHGPLEAVLALQDAVFDCGEDEGCKASRNGWGNTPGRGDLGDTTARPFPGDLSPRCQTNLNERSVKCSAELRL